MNATQSGAMATPTQRMQAVLDAHAKLAPKPLETLTPSEARKQPTPADAVMSLLKQEGKSTAPEAVDKIEDRRVSGANGDIPARVYTPQGSGPFPVLLYFHGGGFVIADKDVYDSSARALCNAAKCVVVSVDYRRAPESKFPAAHDDAIASYRWLLDHANDIGGDPMRIAVAGESAGGNLAANVSIAARDQGLRLPVHQLLVYPVAGSDMDTASYRENAQAKPLDKAMMGWFTTNYFNTAADGQDPRINLVTAKLDGLPPTTIIAAEIDPLRTEGETLEKALRDAGVPVERKYFAGVTHEFFGMGAALDEAKAAVQFSAERLSQDFEAKK